MIKKIKIEIASPLPRNDNLESFDLNIILWKGEKMNDKKFKKILKFIYKIGILVLSTLVFTSFSLAQTPKIAVFDLQRIIKESKAIQVYRKVLEKEVERKKNLLKDKEDKIKSIEEKLKSEETRLSIHERRSLEDSLSAEIKELKRLKEDISSDLKKVNRELSQKALLEISEVIKEFGKKEKYSLIFEKSFAGIAYFDNSFDITLRIIEIYDSKKLVSQ